MSQPKQDFSKQHGWRAWTHHPEVLQVHRRGPPGGSMAIQPLLTVTNSDGWYIQNITLHSIAFRSIPFHCMHVCTYNVYSYYSSIFLWLGCIIELSHPSHDASHYTLWYWPQEPSLSPGMVTMVVGSGVFPGTPELAMPLRVPTIPGKPTSYCWWYIPSPFSPRRMVGFHPFSLLNFPESGICSCFDCKRGLKQLRYESTSSWDMKVQAAEVWKYKQLRYESTSSWDMKVQAAEIWKYKQLRYESTSSWDMKVQAAEIWKYKQLRYESTSSWDMKVQAAEIWKYKQLRYESTSSWDMKVQAAEIWKYWQTSVSTSILTSAHV